MDRWAAFATVHWAGWWAELSPPHLLTISCMAAWWHLLLCVVIVSTSEPLNRFQHRRFVAVDSHRYQQSTSRLVSGICQKPCVKINVFFIITTDTRLEDCLKIRPFREILTGILTLDPTSVQRSFIHVGGYPAARWRRHWRMRSTEQRK